MDLATLIGEYQEDPELFIREVLELEPTWQQQQLLDAIKTYKFIAIKSGHGIGKSKIVAALIWWFLCCFDKPQVPVTAPTSSQLFDALWSRVSEFYNTLNPVWKNNFVLTDKRIYHKKYKNEWFAKAKVSKKEDPEGIAGVHSKNLMFVIDEASGVPSIIFDTIYGALTQENNYCIMLGNPIRLSGEFYDAFSKNNVLWKTFTFNSEESPIVSDEYCNRILQKCGGDKDSNRYRVRVLGKFPKQEDDTLISLDLLEDAISRNVSPSGSIVWGLDIARFGSDSTVLVKRCDNKIIEVKKIKNRDTMEVCGWVIKDYINSSIETRPEKIFIDIIGIGSGPYDRLKEQGYPVVPVNVAEKSNDPKEYRNIRAELYDSYRDWLATKSPQIPDNPEIIQQSSTIKYKYASNGSIQIERKEDYKKRNPQIGSPDIADAIVLTFYKRIRVPLQIIVI